MNGLVNDGMCMQILCCQQGGIKKGFSFRIEKDEHYLQDWYR